MRAIRAVAEGSRHLSPPLSEEMVEAYAQRAVPTGLDLYRTLTQREREVLHLAAEGQTSSQIGTRLNISPRTVAGHGRTCSASCGCAARATWSATRSGAGSSPSMAEASVNTYVYA